jgi:flagellar protein FliL
MAAKTEAPPADAAPAAVPTAAPAGGGGGIKAWIPTIVALVLAPALCWGVAQFLLVPQLKQSFAASPSEAEGGAAPAEAAPAPASAPAKGSGNGKPAKGGEPTVANSFRFENVVVNLAGTMGTRYLKTTFIVTGAQADIGARFEAARPQLLDVTISVLSSLTLHDLEEPGAKNVIRQKLVNSYNQALGQRVAEQVYFSDFVVQ